MSQQDPETEELNARVNMALDELCRTHDGLGVVVFLANPETGRWSIGVSQEMLNQKAFAPIANGAVNILANMINPTRKGL